MSSVFDSYDLSVDELVNFYWRLNQSIAYPDGMRLSLGTIYWGRPEHLAAVGDSVLKLQTQGIGKFSELLGAIRTPGRAKDFAARTGLAPTLLRLLRHDLELWLPKPVPLAALPLARKQSRHFKGLAANGIENQLQMISASQTWLARRRLARRAGIPLAAIEEIAKCCDVYRLGSNLNYIRTPIYYNLGLDTWQGWAASTAEDIIEQFAAYTRQHRLAARLTPWPKEVRSGIEWAKQHLSLFAVEW